MAQRSHLKGINYFVEQGVASLVKKTQTYVLVLRWKIAVHHIISHVIPPPWIPKWLLGCR